MKTNRAALEKTKNKTNQKNNTNENILKETHT